MGTGNILTGSAKLLVKLNGQGSRSIDLMTDSFTIGRKAENDLPIDDPTVSSRHAKIVRVQSVYFVEDLKSTNGTAVNGKPAEEKLDRLRAGIRLADGTTAPARVQIIEYEPEKNLTWLEIVIHEGWNRQVRRMCEAIGHPVEKLKRVRFAFLTLAGVRRGHYRYLEPEEVDQLKSLAGLVKI